MFRKLEEDNRVVEEVQVAGNTEKKPLAGDPNSGECSASRGNEDGQDDAKDDAEDNFGDDSEDCSEDDSACGGETLRVDIFEPQNRRTLGPSPVFSGGECRCRDRCGDVSLIFGLVSADSSKEMYESKDWISLDDVLRRAYPQNKMTGRYKMRAPRSPRARASKPQKEMLRALPAVLCTAERLMKKESHGD